MNALNTTAAINLVRVAGIEIPDETDLQSLIDALVSVSSVDALTGLGNRRALEVAVNASVARRQRRGAASSLAMIDLDHFKAVNDTHGHRVGDDVIRLAAEAIRRHVRAGDTVARFGGDEFVILLGDCDCDTAVTVAARIRSEMETIAAQYGVTMSIGVTECVLGDTLEDALERADNALYVSKETRNTTSIAGAPT